MAKLLLHLITCILLCVCVCVLEATATATAAAPSLSLPGCEDACGNVSIPYPFGMGEGCYLNEWYAVTCNHSSNSSNHSSYTPVLTKSKLEVLTVSLANQTVTLNGPIVSSCNDPQGQVEGTWTSLDFSGSPINVSSTYNRFTAVGCGNALLTYGGVIMAGCTSTCTANASVNGCFGINCCQTSIPFDLDVSNVTISPVNTQDCLYAFPVSADWSTNNFFPPERLEGQKYIPVVMDWKLADLGSVGKGRFTDYDCEAQGQGPYFSCSCSWTHVGNPYVPHGCKVVEACAKCEKDCNRGPAGEFYCNRSKKTEIILGSSFGGGALLLVLCGFCFWLYKFLKKRKMAELRRRNFRRNGGLLLEQQMLSDEQKIETTRIFTSKELEKATDNFNENRVLGQGGQGTVYKGMLSDGRIVAIKKSKLVDESQLEQFINEVVILSQVNHRNIVKILGCCLETEVPLLVYEFICNGNLFELIHDYNEEFPLSWNMRLQISTEVAGALAYLHSASSTPVFHRDIKSTNILLDEKYRAKVSDFGTSKSIAVDQTHLTTLVHGTFGYLDPEYFQTSQLTEKSDVYSYGVVIVELLTGLKPISSTRSQEARSLTAHFISSLEEGRLFDILDARVIKEGGKNEIVAVAEIARRCLSSSGKKRPTMKQVMIEFEGIRRSHVPPDLHIRKNECIIEMGEMIEVDSTSTPSVSNSSSLFSSDVDPLLFKSL